MAPRRDDKTKGLSDFLRRQNGVARTVSGAGIVCAGNRKQPPCPNRLRATFSHGTRMLHENLLGEAEPGRVILATEVIGTARFRNPIDHVPTTRRGLLEDFRGRVSHSPAPGRRAHLIVDDSQLVSFAGKSEDRSEKISAPGAENPTGSQDEVR